MEKARNILFITFLLIIFPDGLYGQSPSPCPKYFEYKTDESGTYGLLHIFPKEPSLPIVSITTLVNFTIADILPSSYIGKLEPLGVKDDLIQQFNDGKPIDYTVHFPVTSPLPQITSIKVNDDVVCSGPRDIPIINKQITNVGLKSVLYLKGTRGEARSGTDSSSFEDSLTVNTGPMADSNVGPRNGNSDTTMINNPNQVSIDWYPSFIRRKIVETPVSQEASDPTMTPHPVRKVRATVNYNECGIHHGDTEFLPLIYNGMTYERGMWPWMVAIYKQRDSSLHFICSGTLVSDRHVITAAHCVHYKSSSRASVTDILVKIGYILEEFDDDNAVIKQLSSVKEHESFDPYTLANDIALLTFTKRVEFNAYIGAACLWTGNPDLKLVVGSTGVVTGWGVSEEGPLATGKPRKVLMPIVSTEQCLASHEAFHQLTSNTTLCAGDRNGAGPCLGDSGSGLYVADKGRWTLRGIASTIIVKSFDGSNCNLREYVVFTDVAKYQTWIFDNMKTIT